MELQCSENYFKIFLPQEARAFGNNIEKEPQKPCLKLKKYVYYKWNNIKKLLDKFNLKEIDAKVRFCYITLFCAD